jgi:FkbM family methyltransferase
VPPTDEYVGKALKEYGEYSQIELELLLQFLQPETTVVIAGGNIGSFVVPLAQHCGEVIVFEPQRWVYQLLCANVVLNNLLNVRAYWGGLGKHFGTIQMPVLDPDQPNNFGAVEIEAMQGLGGDIVPIYKLDSFGTSADCGLLTIDVEGMEEDVLLGAAETVKRCRPVIFFEADRVLKRGAVFHLLRSWGYELYWYRTHLFNSQNFAGKLEDIWVTPAGAKIVAENVLAVPKERGMTLTGFIPVLEA